MDKDHFKKEKDKLNSLYGMTDQERQTSYERIQIAEEHLAEVITKGVDDCPLYEYKSDMLMRALDTALGNLEIDKEFFVKGLSILLAVNHNKAPEHKIIATKEGDNVSVEYRKPDMSLMVATAGDIINEISKCGITPITSLAAALTTILDVKFDKHVIRQVVALLYRHYWKEGI